MIQSLQLILAFFWTRKQTVSLSLLHQELMGHCFRLIHFLIRTTTQPHGEACRALQKWAGIISGTASCQSCHLHVRVQKGEKHRSLKQGSELYCHKIHIVFLSPFKIIKIAYLFLPVWTSSQLFGLLYSFPRYSEDTRLSFQYSLSDPAFQIHCTYASTHSAQGP